MSLVAQLNAALQRRLEANLIIAGEIVATEVRKNIEHAPPSSNHILGNAVLSSKISLTKPTKPVVPFSFTHTALT